MIFKLNTNDISQAIMDYLVIKYPQLAGSKVDIRYTAGGSLNTLTAEVTMVKDKENGQRNRS